MADSGAAFGKMVPGFEFLEGLVKNAGAALPNVGQWIAPTLNPDEIEKRIEELRTVQFWLEQNARMLAATIQALEVQRMTLSTLKTMNVSVGELRDSLILRPTESTPRADRAPDAGAAPTKARPRGKRPGTVAGAPSDGAGAAPAPPAGVVDPMQWWTALTRQFTQLAASAIKDAAPPGGTPPASTGGADTAPKRAAPATPAARKAPGAATNPAAAPRKPPRPSPSKR